MNLLFDQNISPRLVGRLVDLYPGSLHLGDVGLAWAADAVVVAFARENGYVLVTKDSDFYGGGFPVSPAPKVVWIRRGNCSTSEIEAILRRHFSDIANLAEAANLDMLMLY